LGVKGEFAVTYVERIWIGPAYSSRRIFVLGESWYGDFQDDLATDDGYIRAYLNDRVTDALYTRIANACEMEKQAFWEGIMFTNFVQRVGATRDRRPSAEQYRDAGVRLARLLKEHAPRGVWILGREQARHSEPVVQAAGIPVEVTAHPTSFGVKHATLRASWNALLEKAQSCSSAK
jgi:hypothetical protein